MPESGDSSRKARQSEFGLMRPRRKEPQARKETAARNELPARKDPASQFLGSAADPRRTHPQEGRSRGSQAGSTKREAKGQPTPKPAPKQGGRTAPESQVGQSPTELTAQPTPPAGENARGWFSWFGAKSNSAGDRPNRKLATPPPKPPKPKAAKSEPANQPTQLEGPGSRGSRSTARQSAKQRRLNRQQALANGATVGGNQATAQSTGLLGGRSPKGAGRATGSGNPPHFAGSRADDRPASRFSGLTEPAATPKRRPDRTEEKTTAPNRFSKFRHATSRLEAERRGPADSASRSTLGRSPSPAESTVVPLPVNGNRAARWRKNRTGDTQLQGNAPTRLQTATQLQQPTQLQHSTQLQATAPRPRRQRPSRSAPPAPPTEPLFQPRTRSMAIALYASRMLILSIGVGVLAGTVLSAWNPANQAFWNELGKQAVKQANSAGEDAKPQPTQPKTDLQLAQELGSLKTGIQGITQQFTGITPGVFLIDLDTNNYVDWSGNSSLAAASTIKVPVLIAFFQDVDAGKISLNETLTMTKDTVAQGSGDMQYLPVGAKFSALETASKMITISDNTATNMLIKRLGGLEALNQRFQAWGLSVTRFNNMLPDLKGTNTTSAKELASLMVRVSQGELVSLRSRDRILDIMRRTVNNSQLPQGIGEGATIAHKTGDIGTLIGDVGLVDMPSGKRYAIAVLAKREFNDDRAYDLIQKVSRLVYQTLNAPTKPATPSTTAPAPTPQAPPDAQTSPDEGATQGQTEPSPHTPAQSPAQSHPLQAARP